MEFVYFLFLIAYTLFAVLSWEHLKKAIEASDKKYQRGRNTRHGKRS